MLVRLHWYELCNTNDLRWRYDRALYAYCAPRKPEILYIGKCDGTTVRPRWRYDAKRAVWDSINQRSKHHRALVAEVYLFPEGSRLSRQLLADIESLLIYCVQKSVPFSFTDFLK